MKRLALALAALSLILVLAAPADAALARAAAPRFRPAADAAGTLALFESFRETLARILFVDRAERLSTLELLPGDDSKPAPIDLDRVVDFLRRG